MLQEVLKIIVVIHFLLFIVKASKAEFKGIRVIKKKQPIPQRKYFTNKLQKAVTIKKLINRKYPHYLEFIFWKFH